MAVVERVLQAVEAAVKEIQEGWTEARLAESGVEVAEAVNWEEKVAMEAV